LNDIELGLQKNGKVFRYGVTVYYMDYKDQLILTGKINDVGAYTRTNIPKSYRAGIEIEGVYSFMPWLQLSSNLSLSQNKIKAFTEYYDDYDNGGQKQNIYNQSDIAFSPALVNNNILSTSLTKNTELRWISKYVSRQYLDNTSRKDRSLDPYFINDLHLSHQFQTKQVKNISITFQLNNLFDVNYSPNGYTYSYLYGGELIKNNYYYPMAGRNWMLALNITL
jgi:iron complex outermembrane receptor protein